MELQLRIRHEKERLKRENPNAHLRTRTPSLELDTRYIGFEYSCDLDVCHKYSIHIPYLKQTHIQVIYYFAIKLLLDIVLHILSLVHYLVYM